MTSAKRKATQNLALTLLVCRGKIFYIYMETENKYPKILVEVFEQFAIVIVQSDCSTSTREHSATFCVSFFTLLSNISQKLRAQIMSGDCVPPVILINNYILLYHQYKLQHYTTRLFVNTVTTSRGLPVKDMKLVDLSTS